MSTGIENTKKQFAINVKSQEKAMVQLAHLKDKLKDQVSRKAPNTPSGVVLYNEGDNELLEPFTPAISKGSFMTMDSTEHMASNLNPALN